MPSDSDQTQRVLVVGVGEDGPGGLPPSVLSRVMDATLLVGEQRHLDLFPDVTAERLAITTDLDTVIRQIERAAATHHVAVLAAGDPCFFGIGPLLKERLGRARVEIVPNVTSVALAFARLGLSWQDARIVSAHGAPLALAIKAAHGAEKLAVLTDDTNTPSAVAAALLAAGAVDGSAWVFEHLNGPAESHVESSLAGLKGQTFASPSVLVALQLVWLPPKAQATGLFGLPESLYATSGGMTDKPEVRAIALSKLQAPQGGVLWDVGAGSGSLAIEAVGLAPGLTTYAIERSEIQLRHLWRNVGTRTSGNRVRVVVGDAPEVFPDLPDPDAVFVGGSGGRLTEILTAASARVRPNGRIVCNLVTIETLAEALRWSETRGCSAEVVQVSVARGSDIIGMTRLHAENPVTVVTLKP